METLGEKRKRVKNIANIKYSKERPKFETRYCKKSVSGNVVEFIELSSKPSIPNIQKISADQYINLASGEICDFIKSDTRADNKDSLRKSFKRLRDIVNCNTTDNSCIHWVTLTYAKNMTDTKQLYDDFKSFWKRFLYYCQKHKYPKPEYIAVIEPQQRGAWHMHIIIIWDMKRPYIDNNSVFAPMWGHGFTKIQGIPDDCDNLGAYLSAYLSDMALSDDGNGQGKKYVKGARLSLYPVGVNIFRHSRGIKLPISEQLDTDDIEKEKASSGKLTFTGSYIITDDEGNVRYISKSYYNTKRK